MSATVIILPVVAVAQHVDVEHFVRVKISRADMSVLINLANKNGTTADAIAGELLHLALQLKVDR